jgi:hypothetical protein
MDFKAPFPHTKDPHLNSREWGNGDVSGFFVFWDFIKLSSQFLELLLKHGSPCIVKRADSKRKNAGTPISINLKKVKTLATIVLARILPKRIK